MGNNLDNLLLPTENWDCVYDPISESYKVLQISHFVIFSVVCLGFLQPYVLYTVNIFNDDFGFIKVNQNSILMFHKGSENDDNCGPSLNQS